MMDLSDWSDRTVKNEMHVFMIDPHNLNIIRGELEHLVLSGCSVSFGYDTDTRTSANLETLGSNYIDGSWLRIVLDHGGSEIEIGTYVLKNPPGAKVKNREKHYTYELQSVLWGLSEDYCVGYFSIGSGSYTLDAFERICATCGKDYLINGARNYRYTATKIFEAGESYLSLLFDICDISNNRLDVDGHGRITISPYNSPSSLTVSWTVDADDAKTMLISSDITESTSSENVPGRAIVIYSNGDQEIIASADRDSSSEFSSQRRGFMIAEKYQVNDLSPATKARAQELAEQYLKKSDKVITLECSMLYFPCKCGEILSLIREGKQKKYLIQSISEIKFDEMTMNLTLKEV